MRGALNIALKLDRGKADLSLATTAAKTSANAHIRELFERFLPDSQRIETLGTTASADKITKLQGDIKRGAELFSPTGKAAACTTCRSFDRTGRGLSPRTYPKSAQDSAKSKSSKTLSPHQKTSLKASNPSSSPSKTTTFDPDSSSRVTATPPP